ncbi:Citrate-binding protein, partial [Linum perenne]
IPYLKNTLLLVLVLVFIELAFAAKDPTHGFTEVPLKPSNIVLQKPYDVPLDQRYSFVDGVHRMWVYSDDKPFSPGSDTKPRTEIRIAGLDYSSGVWQFEGNG